MTKRKKTSREKRALIGAVCTAAVILAGSTFAWFTSSDEVTNRLTASADYGVALTESFTPPENMTPGQKVNKDVSVVNTGNIDALVRLWFENDLTLTAYGTQDLGVSIASIMSYPKYAEGVTIPDSELANIKAYAKTVIDAAIADNKSFTSLADKTSGTTAYDTAYNALIDNLTNIIKGYYDDELTLVSTTDAEGNVTYTQRTATEVSVVLETVSLTIKPYGTEAYQLPTFKLTNSDGNALTLTTDDFAKAIKLSKEASVASDGSKVADDVTALQAGGQLVVAANVALSPDDQAVSAGANGSYERYKPKASGLYIFRREIDGTNTYVGYYYNAATGDTGGQGDYYAITSIADTTTGDGTDNNTIVRPVNVEATAITGTNDIVVKALTNVALKQETTIDNAKNNVRVAFGTYTPATGGSGTTDSFTQGVLAAKVTKTGENDPADSVTLIEAQETDINTQTSGTAKYKTIELRYAGKDGGFDVKDDGTAVDKPANDDVVFYITLDDDWNDYWYYKKDNTTTSVLGVGCFYLIDDLEAGAVSHKLIDAVTLSSKTTSGSFANLEYDLNAKIQSVQVTYDENGNETTAAVDTSKWKTPNTTEGGLYNATYTQGDEINNAFGADRTSYPRNS